MTNTTRLLTFRHEPGGNILFRASTEHATPDLPLAVTTDSLETPTWSLLDADAVEDLHELTGLILRVRDRTPDAQILCGASLPAADGPELSCALPDGHGPIAGNSWTHITSDGALFELPPF